MNHLNKQSRPRIASRSKSFVQATQNRTRRALLDTIKCQTGLSLHQDAEKFFRTFDTWVENEGIRSATLRLKNIHLIVLCHSLNQPNPKIPFVRTNEGFPSKFLYLKKYLRTPSGIQAVLSLTGWYRGIRAPGIPNFESITTPGTKVPQEITGQIVENIKPNERFKVSTLSAPQIELRSKRGPNGQATLSCLKDLISLPDHLMQSIQWISEAQGGDDFVDTLLELHDLVQESTFSGPPPIHSRLAIKQEMGGKDRVFAIVDYWTQCALKPLHSKLAQILSTIPQDCTFNQGKGVEEIKIWTETSSEIYSFDLKSATDRFPLELQSKVLEGLVSCKEYSSNWANLIANREFKYRNKFYKWATGQPLGAYSSWPIFAYTHHLVVRAAAKQAQVEPSYFLLGDDIVIKGKHLAERYLAIMETLSVEISREKSIFGRHAEFAKRLFTQGTEVSPAPVKMLTALQRDPLLIREVCEHLLSRSSQKTTFERLRGTALKAFASCYGLQTRSRILTLGSMFWSEAEAPTLRGVSSAWPPVRRENFETVYSFIKYSYLMSKYQKSAQLVEKFSRQIEQLELPGTTRKGDPLHPVWKAVERQSTFFRLAHRSVGKYWTSITKSQYLPKDSLPHVESFDLDSLTKSHKSRTRHKANMLLLTHSALVRAKKVFGTSLELQVIRPADLIKVFSGSLEHLR